VIWAILKLDGKTPCTKERFARWAMSGEKVEEHNLISEVGMKSRLEDLGWVEWRSLETSADVTVVMVEKRSPEWMGSCNGGGRLNWAILDVIDFFRLSILEVKKFKNEVDVILAVFAEVFLVEFGWSKLFTVFQRCLGLVQESSVSEKCFFRELFMRMFAR
jgi:hypothetical protein